MRDGCLLKQEVPKAVLKTPTTAPLSKTMVKPLQKKGRKEEITEDDKAVFREYLEDLIGTRAAVVLDEEMEALGKIPVAELASTIKNVANVYAAVFDGDIDQQLVETAEKAGLFALVGMDKKVKGPSKVFLLTVDDL